MSLTASSNEAAGHGEVTPLGRGAEGAAPQRPGRGRRGLGKPGWPIALPGVALVALFFVVPFLLNIRFAFTNWSSFKSDIRWIGLDNFRILIEQDIFYNAVKVTLLFAVIGTVIQNVVSLWLAVLLQDTNRINGFFRSIFFLPVLISSIAAGYIWSAIFAPKGVLNQAIALVVPGFDYAWLGHEWSALVAVSFVDAWKWSGIITLVYIAGLNSIPPSLVDAARIDGASRLQTFWRIKVPLLAPAFTFNLVVSLIGSLSAYDIVVSTTVGGPGNATTVLNIAMTKQWGFGYFGTASALSFTITVLVVAIAVPMVAYLRRREIEM